MRTSLRAALAAVALAAGLAGASGPEAPGRTALSFTISGGVSLGAYQAGFLYYTMEVAKKNPGLFDLRLVTGASAGSVNGLLSVLSHCRGWTESPRQSLFWQTWVPTGLDQLYLPSEVRAEGLFSRRFLATAADRIEAAWREGLPPSCDVVFGVTATRVVPRTVSASGGRLQLPEVEERFALHIRGRGLGRPPQVRNYVDPAHASEQAMLPEDPDGNVPFSSLRDLLFASSAFPVAFSPQPLRHCSARPRQGLLSCPATAATTALFVDGGVFDNNPLRLAVLLAGAGLRDEAGGGSAWLEVPRARDFAPARGMSLASLTVDAVAYPSEAQTDRAREDESLLGLLRQLTASIVGDARAKELLTLLEEHPEIGDRIIVPRRHYPAASEPMAAFFGFFDAEFRAFDFALGMYEARRLLTSAERQAARVLAWPEPFEGRWPAEGLGDWRPLACLRAVFDDVPGLRPACDVEELRDFRILLQTSLERLYDRCASGGDRFESPGTHRHCLAAARGEEPPRLEPAEGAGALPWRRAPGEGELSHVLRLLEAHRFEYRDLGLSRGDAGKALQRIRRRLGEMARQLARAQPQGQRRLVAAGSGLAVNLLAYAAPANLAWLTLGRQLELGYSRSFPGWEPWPEALRLHLALQFHGFASLLSSDRLPFAVAAVGGLEVLPPGLSSAALQFSLTLRAGYVLSNGDGYGARACEGAFAREIGGCSRFAAQAVLAAAALELVRLQLAAEWYPAMRGGEHAMWSLSPAIGFQLGF